MSGQALPRLPERDISGDWPANCCRDIDCRHSTAFAWAHVIVTPVSFKTRDRFAVSSQVRCGYALHASLNRWPCILARRTLELNAPAANCARKDPDNDRRDDRAHSGNATKYSAQSYCSSHPGRQTLTTSRDLVRSYEAGIDLDGTLTGATHAAACGLWNRAPCVNQRFHQRTFICAWRM